MSVASSTATLTASLDGTWVTATGSHGTQSTAWGTECAYNLNATGGATSVTCTASASVSGECQWGMFTSTKGAGLFTFDTANTASSSSCSSCTGVALTLGTANNYLLIQGIVVASSCSAVTQYTGSDFSTTNGFAYKINITVPGTTPVFTCSGGPAVAIGAMAIYENAAGGAACVNRIALLGAGCS